MKKTKLFCIADCPGMRVQTTSFHLYVCETELSKMNAHLRLGQPQS